ncbi:MAG: ketol-acid reductoisomerase, partial [Pseudomonadota bacterium]
MGFKVLSNKEAAAWADILMILAPDEHQAAIYADDIHGNMKPGSALAFAHGLNVHFGLIDVVLRFDE